MVDSLLFNLDNAKRSHILKKLGLQKDLSTDNCQMTTDYALLTLHRPSNVDVPESLHSILEALKIISKRIPIIFPIHPRTRKQVEYFGFQDYFTSTDNNHCESPAFKHGLHCIKPLGYLDFLQLMLHSKFVITDSGGIQEETTVLDIPCLTLRDTTERPITVSRGTNILVHNNIERIIEETSRILDGKGKKSNCPEVWDGRSAERIVDVITSDRYRGY